MNPNIEEDSSLEPISAPTSISDVSIEFRDFQVGDSQKLLELQAIALRASTEFYNAKQIVSLVESQALGRDWDAETFVIATLKQDIIGFAAGLSRHATVTGVYVHPSHSRRGLGTFLLQELEDQIQSHGHQKIEVISSLTAEEFYRANDYEVVAKTGFYSSFDTWIPCIRLKKNLTTSASIAPGQNNNSRRKRSIEYWSYGISTCVFALFLPLIVKRAEELLELLN